MASWWIRNQQALANDKSGHFTARDKRKAQARVDAFVKGPETAKSLLSRMRCSREELLGALRKKFGSAALRTLRDRALLNADTRR